MRSYAITGVASLLLAGVAAIHFALTPDELEEMTYVGVLFIVSGVGATVAAIGIWRSGLRAAWAVGALVCVCTFAGFVLSRTTGLPGGYKEETWDGVGLLSLALEAGFVVLYAVVQAVSQRRRPRLSSTSPAARAFFTHSRSPYGATR